jgi:hypothetical protein
MARSQVGVLIWRFRSVFGSRVEFFGAELPQQFVHPVAAGWRILEQRFLNQSGQLRQRCSGNIGRLFCSKLIPEN